MAMRTLVAAALLTAAAPASLAAAERGWSARTRSAEVGAALERAGNRETLVVSVRPHEGVRIEPPVLRVDAPALVRPHLAGTFPTTVRGAGKKGQGGTIRAALPLKAPGRVGFGDADRNDGALRIEYRYCTAKAGDCSVERVDIALTAGR